MSCGTSVCAAAVVAARLGLVDEGEISVRTAGGLLVVRLAPEGVFLIGGVDCDFEGVIEM